MTNRSRYPCKPDQSNQEVRFESMSMHGVRGLRPSTWHPGGTLSRASLFTCLLPVMHAAASSYQSDTALVRGVGSNFKWIHPAGSVHSRAVRACKHAARSPSAPADMAQPHRDPPTLSIHRTLANAKQRVAKCPRKEPCCGCAPPPFYCWFVKTSAARATTSPFVSFSPSNVDMRKLTKDQNSGGDLTTKGPIYGVQ